MKILFITDNFPPEVNAPATRSYEHCKIWAQNGTDVTVITCVPNYPKGIIFKGYKNKIYQKEEIDGIKVIRVWSYITENSGFLRRSLDYFSFSVSAGIAGIFQKTDLIIATSPQIFATLAGSFISFFKRKPWVFEVRDIWPESTAAVEGGLMYGSITYKFLEYIEKSLYKRSKLIVVVTAAFKEVLTNRGIDPSKIEVFTNGSNLKLFTPRQKNVRIVNELNIMGKTVFGYIGTIGLTHGIDFLVDTFAMIKNPDFHLLILGGGAKKNKIIKQIADLRLKNVTVLDFVSKEEVAEYISVIDFALVNLKKAKAFTAVIPSKIFELAAMEKPILLGVDGHARGIVESYKCGLFYEPENSFDLIEKMNLVSSDPILKIELIEGCRKMAVDYNREKIAMAMLMRIKNL